MEIHLKDGRVLAGREGLLPKLGQMPTGNEINSQMVPMNVVFLDDDLRRTFFPRWSVVDVKQESAADAIPERFLLPQRITGKGGSIRNMGILLKEEPFDEFGRRTIQMATTKGPVELIQCITEITPRWTRVECTKFVWDMRLATSSIPNDQLLPILRRQALRQCKGSELEAAQKLARFFIQAQRYDLAAYEVNRVFQTVEGEEAEAIRKALAPTLALVRQMAAVQALDELQLRRTNGQYALVHQLLSAFPSDGVAGETLQQVRDILDEYAEMDTRIERLIALIQSVWKDLEDDRARTVLQPVLVEILENVNYNSMPRMEAFEDIADVEGVDVNEKAALAVTCWLMGSRHATDRLGIAMSAVRVRQLLQDYMEADNDLARETIFQKFQSEEAAEVRILSAILAHMRPPVRVGKDQWQGKDGFFKLETPCSADEVPVEYWVQLPLEYDPLRLYPAVVCLNGTQFEPQQELEWWTGRFNPKGFRSGQAGRHGYIIIAPRWQKAGQREYDHTPREHAAVLDALKDAALHFSIDPDRVFLSGHYEGGDAAWDIGAAHPDLWAGMVLFSCYSSKYIPFYWPNVRHLPVYYVCGELDNEILSKNTTVLSVYMTRKFDVTVAQYLGRGREPFSDEILRIFDWMKRKKRDFYPGKFAAVSLRKSDHFFWWISMEDIPERNLAKPTDFPLRSPAPVRIEAELIPSANTLKVTTTRGRVQVWLGPKMLDFARRTNVLVNGKNLTGRSAPELRPDLRTLLEDVRVRGDRQNPFWLKLEMDDRR